MMQIRVWYCSADVVVMTFMCFARNWPQSTTRLNEVYVRRAGPLHCPIRKLTGFAASETFFMWLAQSPERKATPEGWPRAVSIKRRSNSFNKHSSAIIQRFHSIPPIHQSYKALHIYLHFPQLNQSSWQSSLLAAPARPLFALQPFCRKQRCPSS